VSGLHPAVRSAEFIVISDVNNPLTGRYGAARVFGPQKGADPDMVKLLDKGLARFAAVVKRQSGKDISRVPGAGAAGGLGAGLHFFLGALILEGSRFIVHELGLRQMLKDADLLITGEGKIDGQVKFGKAILAVIEEGKRAGIPAIAFCGQVTPDVSELYAKGLCAVFPILPGPVSLEEAMARAPQFLQTTAGQVARLLKHARSQGRQP